MASLIFTLPKNLPASGDQDQDFIFPGSSSSITWNGGLATPSRPHPSTVPGWGSSLLLTRSIVLEFRQSLRKGLWVVVAEMEKAI